MTDRFVTEYRTIGTVKGPLIFVRAAGEVFLGDLVEIELDEGLLRYGQVIELTEELSMIQVFGETDGINPATTRVRFREEGIKMDLSPLILGRTFTGAGRPRDGGPPVPGTERRDIAGEPINPVMRDMPRDFIQTGISSIDGMNTLVRGQKLPVFSGSGLPANEIAAQIVRYARVSKKDEKFALVFAGMGLTSREADFFTDTFVSSGALEHSAVFLNTADDSAVERLLTPRFALTAAEYLAFTLDYQVLVVLTDMTQYCNALREVASSREEIPGRRGYPGYMYTDLAGIYERAGRIKEKRGSITQLPILTMPDDDITHPVPDLTGYITEGQIVLDRALHRRTIFPPINVLPSLSRLMKNGIGQGRTREDHGQWSDQLYMAYAKGVDQRGVASIIGEEGLSELDRQYMEFAREFEERFIGQGMADRDIEETLALGWELLAMLPTSELIRVSRAAINEYLPQPKGGDGGDEEA